MDENNERELVYMLHAAAMNLGNRANDVLSELLTELDLTRALSAAIWQLDPDQQWPSMRKLAQRLSCDPSTVTFLVDRLTERGLAQRTGDAVDRRVKVVSLTAKGGAVRARMAERAIEESLFKNLSAPEMRQLLHLIRSAIGEIDYSVAEVTKFDR
ncbi:MAG: MarR family transcriptional regulator [Pseudonocardia sp.]|nr:MAG: MarR family transcriptional regulator [Pseudonocardia sp.]